MRPFCRKVIYESLFALSPRFARGLAARFKALFKLPANQAGFSIVGVVTASAIGLIVIMGTTQSFIQQRISFLALEKRLARIETNRRMPPDGRQRFMGRDWDCLKTLEKQKLLNTPAPYSAEKRGFEITAIKDSAGRPLWGFAKDSAGKLLATEAPTKASLKKHGIDDFERLDFFYETGPPETGRIVLSSKTSLPGLLEGRNPDIVWELSGLTVKAKTAEEARDEGLTQGAGDYVIACRNAAPSKNPCDAEVSGAFHTNPDGSKGGFVADTAEVDSTVFVGPNAAVCGTAKVKRNADIKKNAKVYWHAFVIGPLDPTEDRLTVTDNARVYGNAIVTGSSRISGNAEVYMNAQVLNKAQVSGNAIVRDYAKIRGSAQARDDTLFAHDAIVGGNAQVYGNAKITGDAMVYGFARVLQSARVYGNAQVYDRAIIQHHAQISGTAKIGGNASVAFGSVTAGTLTSGRH